MALINLNLINNTTTTINSSNFHSGDTVALGLVSNATLIVDGVNADITSFAGVSGLSSTTFQVINGSTLTVEAQLASIGAGSSFHYIIGAGSTLNINSALLGIDVLQTTTVDFAGSTGTGHFVYTPPAIGLSLLSPSPTIVNASAGDRVTVNGSSSVTQSGNVITFHGGLLGLGTLATYVIPAGATYSFNDVTDTLTFITPCFVRGTLIATPDGDVPVEKLKAGDLVLSLNKGTATIIWVGSRTIDPRILDKPRNDLPVRIHAGAIADGVPQRDLLVSPDHCLFIGGTLVPAKLLINDTTVTQKVTLYLIDYFHIELEKHDVIWAEGAMTETYLDLGNRNVFLEQGVLQFTSVKAKEAKACYPFAYMGPAVDKARDIIAARENTFGYTTESAKAS
ncbi:Hint domain-containing protein [Phyllobacterium sp. 628]|uniref:Hint domain-containing protein n=1 Tax=Phyllobacterium sp. 628 TaxID=2718938 RepID=UPI0016626E44|nr:Hint domain-containing protein [Phyllobacterium sp. 628]QND52345.1 Hint domain-containing protein [Phyllobacterium sp. 628]